MNKEPETNFSLTGEKIPKKKMVSTWKSLTSKPYPYGKIKAHILSTDEMDKALEIMKNSPNVKSVTKPEYGKELPIDSSTSAATFIETRKDDTKGFMIFIRNPSQVSIQENLEHELKHIINGDITLDGKAFNEKSSP